MGILELSEGRSKINQQFWFNYNFNFNLIKKMKQIIRKLLIIVLLITVLVWVWFTIKLSVEKYNIHKIELKEKEQEEEKIAIDEYNFEQLENAKIILDKISKENKKFYKLKDFNITYNADIKPIKNCYYISNSNWREPYIFWFKLESGKYIKEYWSEFYAYPKYDKSILRYCGWGTRCDDDLNFVVFSNTISNPCQD